MAERTLTLLLKYKEERSEVLRKLQGSLQGVDATLSVLGKNLAQSTRQLSTFQSTVGTVAKAAQTAGSALRAVFGTVVQSAGAFAGILSVIARAAQGQGGTFHQIAEKLAVAAQAFGGAGEHAQGFFGLLSAGTAKLHAVVAALTVGGLVLRAFGVDMGALVSSIARVVPGLGAVGAAAGGMFTALRQSGLGTQVLVAGLSAVAIVAGKFVEAVGHRLVAASRAWLDAAVESERNAVSLGIAIASYEQATGVAIGSTAKWSGFIRQLSADTAIGNGEIERSTVVLLRQAQQLRLSATDTEALLKVAADLAVVYQRDFGDALTAVTSALQGHGLKLRGIGVDMTDAAVAAHQLGDATGRVFAQMNPAQQALLRLRELLSTTTGVSGKAAEIIGGTLAGAFARARVSNQLLNEQLGAGTARVFGPLAQIYASLAANLATLPPALFDVVGATIAFAGVAGVVVGKVSAWAFQIGTLVVSLVALDTALGGSVVLPFIATIAGAAAQFVLWGAAVAAVGIVVGDLAQRSQAFLQETGLLDGALQSLRDVFGRVGDGARSLGAILRSLVPDGPITALRKINETLFSTVAAAYAAAAGWKAFRAAVQEKLGLGGVDELRAEAERLKDISLSATRQTAFGGASTEAGKSLQQELAALRASGGARERSVEAERALVGLQRQKIDAALREAELLGKVTEARRLSEKLARLELSDDLRGENAGVARVVLAQRYAAARRAGYDIAKRDLDQVQQASLTVTRAQSEAAQRAFQLAQQGFAQRRVSEAELVHAAEQAQRANMAVLGVERQQALAQEQLAKQHGATAQQLQAIHATVLATTAALVAQRDVAADTARDLAEAVRGIHEAQRGAKLELSEQSADILRAQLDQAVELAGKGQAAPADAIAKARELESALRGNLALRVEIAQKALDEATAGRASTEELVRLNTELTKANVTLSNADVLIGRTTKDVVERLETGIIRIGPFLRESFGQVFDGLIAGTLSVKDALKSTVLSFGKRIFDAFLEDKLHFEGKIQVNVLRDLPNIFQKGGNAIAGIWGELFGRTLPAALSEVPSAAEDAARMSSVALHGIPADATSAFAQTAAVAQQGAQAVGNAAGTATSMWGQFFSFLLSAASSAFGGLVSLATSAIQAIGGLLSSLGSGAGSVLSAIVGGAGKLLGGGESGGGIVGGIINVAKTVLGTGGIISKGISAVGSVFQGSGLAQTASSIFGQGGTVARFFGGIRSAITSSRIGPLVSSLGNLVGVIGGGFAAFQGAMALFSKKASGLQRVLGGVESLAGLSTAFTSLQRIVPAFARFAQSISSAAIVGAGRQAPLALSNGAVGITDFVRAFASKAGFGQVSNALGQLPRALFEGLKAIIPQFIKDAVAAVARSVVQLAARVGLTGVATTAGAQGSAVAGQAAGKAGAGFLGSLALPAAVIGALYSIAQGIKGVVDNTKFLRQVERGDAAAGRAGAIQGVHLAVTTAVGALAGLLIGGPIGAVIGAGIGAAVGSVVNAQLTKLIAAVTANVQKGGLTPGLDKTQIRQGISQQEFGKQLKAGLSGDTLLNVLSLGGNKIMTALLGGLVTPDIEKIFNKIFVEAIQKALPKNLINRQLGEFLGQGVVGPKRRESLEAFRPARREDGTVVRAPGVLRSDTRGTAALVSGLIGAGSENMERIARFTNILANNLASGKKNTEAIRDELFTIVRSVTGNLITGLGAVNVLFEGGLKRATMTRKEVDLVARSFQSKLPTVDLQGITKAAQRTTGGVDVRQVRQGVRLDVLGDAQRGEIELTKKVTKNFGDVFTDVVRRLHDRVKDIDVLGIAIRVATEDVKPKGGYIRELQNQVREAVLVAASAGELTAEQVKADSKALGDGFLLVAAKLQEKVGPSIDVFALAAVESADKARRAVKDLASDVKIQMSLVAKALPTLAPEEAAQATDMVRRNARGRLRTRRGRKRTAKVVDSALEARQGLIAFLEAATLKVQGLGSLAIAQQAGRQALAARTRLDTTIASLPTLGPKKRNAAIAELPQLAQQAVEAFDTINQAVADLTQQLKDAASQAEDFALSTQETIDALRGGAHTAELYSAAVKVNEAKLTDLAAASGSAADQLALVTREMDLLQRQASAQIQDVQDIADAQKKVHQARLDAIDKELEGIGRIAGMADSLGAQVSSIRLANVTSPFRQVESIQKELARQKDIFRTTKGDTQAAAAERISSLSDQAIKAASDAFGPATAEFASVQREVLAGLEPIEKVAREAGKRQVALLEEQKNIQTLMKGIDEKMAADIAIINTTLAGQLEQWAAKAKPLFELQQIELATQLGAALLVQTQARDHLAAIVKAINKLAGITDTETAAGPIPSALTARQELQLTGQVLSTRAQGLKPNEALNAGIAKDIPNLIGAYLPGGRFFDVLTQLAKKAGTANLVSADIAALSTAITKHAKGTPWTKGDLDSVQRLLKDLLKQVGGAEPRARGGPVVAGKPYLVGERGVELVIPQQAATVVDHRNTKEVLRVIQKQSPAPALRLVGTTVSRALPPSRTSSFVRQAAAVVAAIGLAAGVARGAGASIRPAGTLPLFAPNLVSGTGGARGPVGHVAGAPRTPRSAATLDRHSHNELPQTVNLRQQLGRVLSAPFPRVGGLRSPLVRVQQDLGHALTSPRSRVQQGIPSPRSFTSTLTVGKLQREQVQPSRGGLAREALPVLVGRNVQPPRIRVAALRTGNKVQDAADVRRLTILSNPFNQGLTSLPTRTAANLPRLVTQRLDQFTRRVEPFQRAQQLDHALGKLTLGAVKGGPVDRHGVTSLQVPTVNARPQVALNVRSAASIGGQRQAARREQRIGSQMGLFRGIDLGPRLRTPLAAQQIQLGRATQQSRLLPNLGLALPAQAVRGARGVLPHRPISRDTQAVRVANVQGAVSRQVGLTQKLGQLRFDQRLAPIGPLANPRGQRVGVAHGALPQATYLPRLPPASLPHLATGGVMKRDAVVQLHKSEIVIPLSSKTALTQVGSAIARAIVTSKPTVGEPITRRNRDSGPTSGASRSSNVAGATQNAKPPKVEITLNVTVNPAKGESLARATLFGRTAGSAAKAEILEDLKYGATGKHLRKLR